MRFLIFLVSVAVIAAGCSSTDDTAGPYGASATAIGTSLHLMGWNMSLANLRWDGDHVLVDVDAAPTDPTQPYVEPKDIRFGLYGALPHPIEATGLGSCAGVTTLAIRALAVTPERLTGTVCLGPLQERRAVRGVYAYSPRDRIEGTAAAYAAAFPVGVLPPKTSDTGLRIHTTSVEAWRDDGAMLTQQSLGDVEAFRGNGYMLLGLQVSGVAEQYRDDSVRRGGPMMIVVSPSVPDGEELSNACRAYGSSVLVLPDAKLDAVRVDASLCTQGEINEALLYPTLSVIGTRAGVWISRD